MSHENIFLEDIDVTGSQVWKLHSKPLCIELMTALHYAPNYVSDPKNTKVSIRTVTISII